MNLFKTKFRRFKSLNKKEKQQYFRLFFLMSIAFNIMFFGGLLNMAAIRYNNNYMPVFMTEGYSYEDTIHKSYSNINQINLFYLTDIIYIKGNIYSIGDFIIFFGATLSIIICLNVIILDYKVRRIRKNGKTNH